MDFTALEQGSMLQEEKSVYEGKGRIVQDLSSNNWQMERMRIGQGVEEGIHLLKNELSGNNFSWNFASVPGDVYTDLYRAGEIENPLYARNMGRVKWVQDYEWWYNYAFNADEQMKGQQLTLVFEGVDYSCEVWLNGYYLGDHEGTMTSFSFDVTDYIDFKQPHVPANLIAVKINAPEKNQKNIAGKRHNFAGDYLTGLIPVGIWKPVKLIGTGKVKVENYRVESRVQGKDARVEITMTLSSRYEDRETVSVHTYLSDGEKQHLHKKTVQLEKGQQQISIELQIEDAKLWWPYDLGESFLYDLGIHVYREEDKLDTVLGKVGIRQIEMMHNPGYTMDERELPWTFTVNGKSMFLRSACWGGPPSFFYGMNSPEKYRYYLEKAKACHINNLRIFGWHPVEVETFYSLCDELGITVWTNFAFATQVFRDDEPYVQEVLSEVGQIVVENRNHPSMIMWMGGEEVYFSEAHVDSANRQLMERIGEEVRQLTSVPYADASPLSSREGIRMGYKPKESAHANSHYYAAGAVFMEDYYPYLDYCIIPELTAASAPNVESLKKFIPEDELWPMGPSWGYHAADIHVLQNLNYEVFGDTCMQSLETFVEATQIAQGTILQFALEHFRRCKPKVSGVSLCHFITNWPIVKWDIIDYYGEEKKSYEFVKQSYQPLLPSMCYEKRRYLPGELFTGEMWVVNDHYKVYEHLQYRYTIKDQCGAVKASGIREVEIGENTSEKCFEITYTIEGVVGEEWFVVLELVQDDKVIATNEYLLLIADQELAKEEAGKLYKAMHEERRKYGRGYYRYMPEQIYNDN